MTTLLGRNTLYLSANAQVGHTQTGCIEQERLGQLDALLIELSGRGGWTPSHDCHMTVAWSKPGVHQAREAGDRACYYVNSKIYTSGETT